MFKFFYNKFWYPVFGGILSKFVFLIEGSNNKRFKSKNIKKNMNKWFSKSLKEIYWKPQILFLKKIFFCMFVLDIFLQWLS